MNRSCRFENEFMLYIELSIKGDQEIQTSWKSMEKKLLVYYNSSKP